MSRKTNASAAELARGMEQHLPVFARPTLEQLIAAVQRETRAQAAHDRTPPPPTSAGEAHPAHD